jgi:hypothetical protein
VAELSGMSYAETSQASAVEHNQRLANAIGQLRFGVPVNAGWTLRLHALVEQRLISENDLRRLLSTPAVGVNKAGEMRIIRSSLARRWAWWLWIAALLSMCVVTHVTHFSKPAATMPSLLLFADVALLPVLRGLHWLGPLRWQAERRLLALTQHREPL